MKIYLKSAICSLCISVIGILILALFITYSNMQESTSKYIIIIISSCACFVGTLLIGINKTKNGIMYGGIYGIIYLICLFLLSIIINKGIIGFNINSVYYMISVIVVSIIGGILGVNSVKK